MSGVEKNPGPTRSNQETINWLSENGAKDYKLCSDAEKFFGNSLGSKNTVIRWKEKFEAQKKELKREVSLEIMKENGGLMGKQYHDNPPHDFFPRNRETLMSTINDNEYKCKICEDVYHSEDDVKAHIKSEHQKELSKYFRKEAYDLVMSHALEWPTLTIQWVPGTTR